MNRSSENVILSLHNSSHVHIHTHELFLNEKESKSPSYYDVGFSRSPVIIMRRRPEKKGGRETPQRGYMLSSLSLSLCLDLCFRNGRVCVCVSVWAEIYTP